MFLPSFTLFCAFHMFTECDLLRKPEVMGEHSGGNSENGGMDAQERVSPGPSWLAWVSPSHA